jgi:DNA gyrase subunit B
VLGAGIGKEEYNPDKLRNHRVIIMTDADVDGSHIRTLLLTFFYRQMPELVERGHIYIAQPPLYKIKHGRQERYLKDDHELKEYLLRLALSDAELVPRTGVSPLTGEALAKVAREFFLAEAVIERVRRLVDEQVLYALLRGLQVDLSDAQHAEQSAERLQRALPAPELTISARYDDTTERWSLEIVRLQHGNRRITVLDRDFLGSGDYEQIHKTGELIGGLLGAGASVRRGEQSRSVTEFKEALDWLLEEVKNAATIQRYKGLGEMNPEQLWETTMDPQTRRLLRAQIEDSIAADEIFTTLMGDMVEPRRAFIETNALGVRNLDV